MQIGETKMKMLTDKTPEGMFSAFTHQASKAWIEKNKPDQEENRMICFKLERKIVYFSTPNEKQHFVPKGTWKVYLLLRHVVPMMCHIYNTIQEARTGAIDYYDEGPSHKFIPDRGATI